MERLGDDLLGLILKRLDDKDRKSSSLVSKTWLRVEGLTRTSLRVLQHQCLSYFLPRFPNLIVFESSKLLTDHDIKFVARSCPRLKVINLDLKVGYNSYDLWELGSDGVIAIGVGCPELTDAFFPKRHSIGDRGVVPLVQCATNLRTLDLSFSWITDRSLEAMAAANSLRVLNLDGCSLITDKGLASLANGSLSRTLENLSIANCERITDAGSVEISSIQTLKILDLSELRNITNATLSAIAQNCLKLEELYLTHCVEVRSCGLHAFVNHQFLKVLGFACGSLVSPAHIVNLVTECKPLRYIELSAGMKLIFTSSHQERITENCKLTWKPMGNEW